MENIPRNEFMQPGTDEKLINYALFISINVHALMCAKIPAVKQI
jgi:hypothetical protein